MNPRNDALKPSLLDRLIDDEPGVSHEPGHHRYVSLARIKAAVIRDLENLLNTRRNILIPAESHQEVGSSVFVYGLRDYTAQNPKSPSARQHLRLDVERTIALFEPRLRNVTVHLDSPDPNERNLRFRITALLVAEPVTEPVAFDTFFDANRGEYYITM
jgi:type VI secretion system protein ImpF